MKWIEILLGAGGDVLLTLFASGEFAIVAGVSMKVAC
jgi:hypothetical protein